MKTNWILAAAVIALVVAQVTGKPQEPQCTVVHKSDRWRDPIHKQWNYEPSREKAI